MARKVRVTCSPRRGNLAAHNESEMDPAAARGGRGRGRGNPSAARNITGKGRKAQLTAKISAASNGAPAPRVPLAMAGEATPMAIPTPVSSVVSYALPRPSDSITFGGAGWSINGHGILDEKLNGPGDGVRLGYLLTVQTIAHYLQYCFICRDGGEVVLCMVGARCENAVCLKCIGTLPPNWQTLQFSCPMCHSKSEVLRLDYAKSKGEIATLQPYMVCVFVQSACPFLSRTHRDFGTGLIIRLSTSTNLWLHVRCLPGLPQSLCFYSSSPLRSFPWQLPQSPCLQRSWSACFRGTLRTSQSYLIWAPQTVSKI